MEWKMKKILPIVWFKHLGYFIGGRSDDGFSSDGIVLSNHIGIMNKSLKTQGRLVI